MGYMWYFTTVHNKGGWGGGGGARGWNYAQHGEGGGSVGYMQYSTTVHKGWVGGQTGNYGIGAVLHNSVVLLVFSAVGVLHVLCWV